MWFSIVWSYAYQMYWLTTNNVTKEEYWFILKDLAVPEISLCILAKSHSMKVGFASALLKVSLDTTAGRTFGSSSNLFLARAKSFFALTPPKSGLWLWVFTISTVISSELILILPLQLECLSVQCQVLPDPQDLCFGIRKPYVQRLFAASTWSYETKFRHFVVILWETRLEFLIIMSWHNMKELGVGRFCTLLSKVNSTL